MICARTAVTPRTATASANTAKLGAARGQPEADGGDQQHRRDQAPALEQVAERDQQRQPDHVAGLGDRDQQARGAVRHRERVRDRVQQRLGVVEVRHRRAAREREQQNQRPADAGAELRCLSVAVGHRLGATRRHGGAFSR